VSDEAPPPVIVPLPPNEAVIRGLLDLDLYDQAIDELRYAQAIWGDSSPISATMAWTYREQGSAVTGSQQFSLYRGAINLMKRAYPQYLAAGGEQLPRDILRIIFPIGYWDLIRKNATERGLDPYLVAALAAQESTFVANIRSPAKATGVLQLEASTAKQYAKHRNRLPRGQDSRVRRLASGAGQLQRRRTSGVSLAGGASGPVKRRIHRRYSVSRNAKLCPEDSRHGRGLPADLRAGVGLQRRR
jgi:hypothetical protein